MDIGWMIGFFVIVVFLFGAALFLLPEWFGISKAPPKDESKDREG